MSSTMASGRHISQTAPAQASSYVIDLAILIIMVALAYFSRAHSLPLRGEEPTRAQMAFEMVQLHDWTVPREQGEPFLVRPPMQNWAIALSCLAFGNWGFEAVRFHALISTLLTTLIIYAYCRIFLTRIGALAAAAAFLTLPEMFQMGRQAETEALFTFFVGASLLLWHWGILRNWLDCITFPLGYAFMALATLTKGIQAPAYFIGSIGTYLILTRQWRRLFSWQHLLGIVTAVTILVAWIVPYGEIVGWSKVPLVWFGDPAITYNGGVSRWHPGETALHLLKYPANIFAGMLPWSGLLVFFAFREIRRAARQSEAARGVFFACICLAIAWPSCWIPPGSLPRYFAPLYPSTCVLIGIAFQCAGSSNLSPLMLRLRQWLVTLMAFVVGFSVIVVLGAPLVAKRFAAVQPLVGSPFLTAFYTVTFAVLALLIFRSRNHNDAPAARMFILSTAVFMIVMVAGLATDFRIRRSEDAATAVAQLKAHLPPRQQLVSIGGHTAPMFAYYYGSPLIIPLPMPTAENGLGLKLSYFCFMSSGAKRPRLPFAWEEISVVPLDRNHHDAPLDVIVVGRRISQISKAGEGGRTLDIHVGNVTEATSQTSTNQGINDSSTCSFSIYSANETVNGGLQEVIEAWQTVTPAVRDQVLAMIRSARAK